VLLKNRGKGISRPVSKNKKVEECHLDNFKFSYHQINRD
jgi:hypothetical protein